ncbi:hypothetical protein GCM10027058_18100 [Microbacterium neimengense]
MATKNDLIEAQTFSRRRLLTAFVSGAPGGKELEPTAPLRAVIAAIALTVGVVLVGVFYGLIRPGLPNGWDNGKLIIVKDTGSRFITQDGVLYPVINTASARLLLPSSDFQVIDTDQQNLEGVRLGPTLGIVGAPDEIPTPAGLTNSGWGACVTDDAALDVRIGGAAPQEASGRAVVVDAAGSRYVISDGLRFAVSKNDGDAVLRAAGIGTLNPVKVPVDWLNLFTPGADLAPCAYRTRAPLCKGHHCGSVTSCTPRGSPKTGALSCNRTAPSPSSHRSLGSSTSSAARPRRCARSHRPRRAAFLPPTSAPAERTGPRRASPPSAQTTAPAPRSSATTPRPAPCWPLSRARTTSPPRCASPLVPEPWCARGAAAIRTPRW